MEVFHRQGNGSGAAYKLEWFCCPAGGSLIAILTRQVSIHHFIQSERQGANPASGTGRMAGVARDA
jgi:hypothetical protein